MSTAIPSLGVGSGLPLDSLLQQLRTAENAPLAAINTRATKEQQRFSAYGTLKSALDNLSTAAEALGKSETFHAVKTNVTGDTFTASAAKGSGALPGNHSISVQQLATSQVLASGRATANDTAFDPDATGTVNINFTVADSAEPIQVSVAANATLQDIAKAINENADLDFSASLMNDGEGHRLILSSNTTGDQNVITGIQVDNNDSGAAPGFADLLNYARVEPDADGNPPALTNSALGETVVGRNAQATINGIQVSSQTNTLEDAIEGVTLTLNKQTEAGGAANMLNVTRDDGATTTAVTNFVNAYNALQSTIKSLTSYDVDAQEGAALSGDSLARRAQSQAREAINGLAVNGVTLSSLGIKTDPTTGNLSVDNDKLTEALTNNRADVEALFAGEGGLSKRVTSTVELFTKSDGLIKSSQDGIERTLKLLETQYDQTEARIDQKMETYRLQFVQLDSFMAQMNGISSYLTTQLSMLQNLGSGNDKK